MERAPITRQGYEQLQARLKQLKEVELPRIQKAIGEALAHGDLAENAELDAAREESARAERFIAELERQHSVAEVIDGSQVPHDSIAIGARITLEDLRRGGTFDYLLVGEGETRDAVDTVSVSSPLGRTLIGKASGEVVEFQGPRGPLKYKVVSFRYE